MSEKDRHLTELRMQVVISAQIVISDSLDNFVSEGIVALTSLPSPRLPLPIATSSDSSTLLQPHDEPVLSGKPPCTHPDKRGRKHFLG